MSINTLACDCSLRHSQKQCIKCVDYIVSFFLRAATCPTWCRSLGDMGRLLAAVGASEYDTVSGSSKAPLAQQLREEARREIRKMRYQLTEELNLLVPDLQLTLDPRMPPPDGRQMLALRQLILCACVDRIARKKSGKVRKATQFHYWVTICLMFQTNDLALLRNCFSFYRYISVKVKESF